MNRTVMFLAAAAAVLTTAGAAQAAGPRERVLVTPQWLNSHLKDPDLVIIHVGDQKGFEAGHIPGAHVQPGEGFASTQSGEGALTLELPDPKALHDALEKIGVSNRSRIVVYLAAGQVPSATRTVFTLDAAGLGDKVVLLDGGLAAWKKAGLPTSTTESPIKPGVLHALKVQGKVVDAEFVQAHINKPGYTIVDARAPVFYDGLQAGGMPAEKQPKGHIPGAVNVPFTSISTDQGAIKPADELLAQFRKAGVKPGDKLVVYCHVGYQGSAVVFAARSVGIDAKLYDGSFQDWSRRRLPVEGPGAGK